LPELAKEFKLRPGSEFTFASSHKGVDRLTKLYAKKDHLEARIQMDRTDESDLVNLKVEVEAGQPVKFAFSGTGMSGSTAKLVRRIWQEGISDRHRLSEAEGRLRLEFAKEGYLEAKVVGKVTTEADAKRVAFELQPGTRFRKVQTVFEGATPDHAEAMAARIRQRRLTDAIYLEPGRVAEDLAAYYRQQGHYLAKVDPPRFDLDRGGGIARVVFAVKEGPTIRVRQIEFEGNKTLTASQLAETLPLKQGSVVVPDLVQKSVAAISDLYGRAGFRNPDIETRFKLNEEQSSVDLAFSIQEGGRTFVRSLGVSGQERVSEKYVREQLRIREDEPQNFPETSQSIRSLYNTGAFANVSIESTANKDAAPRDGATETVDLVVKVQEVLPYKVRYGGYFDSGRGPGVIFDVENRNSLGDARVLGLRTRYDKDLQEARLYLTQPLWRRHPLPTTGTLYFRRENDYYEGLSAQRTGFTLQQEAMFKKTLILSYGIRIEDVYTWYPDQRAPNPPRELVSPLLLSLTRNTRDDFLDPTRGSFTSTAMEYAPGIVGDHTKYIRLFGQYFKYFPLFKPGFAPFQGETKRPRTIFATGIRVGLIKSGSSQPIIPTERFYAGGGTTVRGFEQDTLGPLDEYGDPLGGNAMMVLNNELRFPMVSVLDGVGFVDVGNVFPTVSDFRLSELRKTAGLGLRFRIPGLMLRFDYGLKLDRRPGESRGAFFFSIGQAF
jgi:outer membrane protein assembly complex protein YaeT